MKKLLLSIFTLVSVAAFAQKDLAVRLVTPAMGQEIVNNKPFNFQFVVRNAGMDTIKTTDSILVSILVNFQSAGTVRINLQNALKPTDSLLITVTPAISLPISEDDTAIFCAVAEFADTMIVDTNGNNVSCTLAFLKVIATGVSELATISNSVKAYPNPTSSYFTITMKSTDATVEIMDITGKLVSTYPVTMGEAKMDVSNYNNGVYFYQIKTAANETVKSGKFTVSH